MTSIAQKIDSALPMQYFDFLQMGVMLVDENKRIVYWNKWLETHSNHTSHQIYHQLFSQVFPELTHSRLSEVIAQAIHDNMSAMISATLNRSLLPLYTSTNHQYQQGDYMRQMVQVSPLANEQGKRFALIQISDMTHALANKLQMQQQSQTIHHLRNSDTLTEIANRHKFDLRLEEEYRRAQRAGTSLVMGLIDIDQFKLFNDQYGTAQGDRCLAEIANGFDAELNRSTDFVARYSGQVFAVILPCTTLEGAINVAINIKSRIESLQISHEASSISPHLTASIGFATMNPLLNDDLKSLIDAAEFALKEAKQAGGNQAMLYTMQDGSLHHCDSTAEDIKIDVAIIKPLVETQA